MRLRRDKGGDAVGRPSWRSSLLGDPGENFFVETQQMKKLTKFREHLSHSRWHAPLTGWFSNLQGF